MFYLICTFPFLVARYTELASSHQKWKSTNQIKHLNNKNQINWLNEDLKNNNCYYCSNSKLYDLFLGSIYNKVLISNCNNIFYNLRSRNKSINVLQHRI